MRQHWAEANAAFPANTIVRMVDDGEDCSTDRADVADVQALLRRAPDRAGAPRRSTRSLERQRVNAALRERERVDFAAAL